VVMNAFEKIIHRFDVPATHLVIASSGQHALALIKRNTQWRVSRLNFTPHQVTDLGMRAFDHFAKEYDGAAWTVAQGHALQVLDTQHNTLTEILWHVPDLPHPVSQMAVSATAERILVGNEVWYYNRYPRQLYSRAECVFDPLAIESEYLCAHRGMLTLKTTFQTNAQAQVQWLDPLPKTLMWQGDFSEHHFSIHAKTSNASWMVLMGSYLSDGDSPTCELRWVNTRQAKVHAAAPWPAPHTQIQARFTGDHCLVFDPQGRLLHLNTQTGENRALSVR
jgi:hypothetical protein